MALLIATLKAELVTLASAHAVDEAAAITAWGDALGVYWAGATANGIPIVGSFVILGVTAAKAALVGMSADGAGFGKIQAACIAGWAAMALPGAFTTNTAAIPPTGLAGLAAALQTAGDANTAGDKSIDDACQALADVWQPLTITGGTATFPGPVVFPIL